MAGASSGSSGEAGAEALTFATEALTGRRKTNTRDAAALARLVDDRTVHGNTTTSRIVREPSPEEQQRRFLSRHRGQLIALRGKIEAQGRGLMLDFGRLDFPDCWWGKKMSPRLVAQLTAAGEDWLREALEPQRAMAQALHAQILELDARLAAVAAQTLTVPLPHGLGQLTALTACLEVMDWQRFSNRKKVGSYIGCAPSENSTGGPGQLLGQIDRQGNRRLRSLLTEAIWRLLRWEPGWQGFAKWGAVIREGHGSTVAKRKPSSPACGCSSSTSGGSSPAGLPWPISASGERPASRSQPPRPADTEGDLLPDFIARRIAY